MKIPNCTDLLQKKFQAFLNLELDGGQWSDSYHGHFTTGERGHSTHWIGDWVDPRANLNVLEKILTSCPCYGLNNNFCHPAHGYSKLWRSDIIMQLQPTFYNTQLIAVCHISSYDGSCMTNKIQLEKQNTTLPHFFRFPTWATKQTSLKTWAI